jgi:flagellar hook-associated protein 3 FlgL
MRLSDQMMRNTLLRNITTNRDQLYDLQQELSSGEKVLNVSKDPGLYKQISRLEETQAKISGYTTNISTAKSELNTYEDLLNNLTDTVTSLKNLTLKANNSTYYTTSQETFRQEVDDTLEYLVQIANNKVSGKYMFAGSEVEEVPYTAVKTDGIITSVTYNGDNKQKTYDLDTDDKITINMSGTEVFQGRAGMDEDVFQAVIDLRQDMTTDTLENADEHLAQLQNIMDRLNAKKGEIGNKVSHMEDMESFMDNFKLTIDEQHADLRYTDMTEAISTLMNIETTLQASLQVAARMNNISIMDYLK